MPFSTLPADISVDRGETASFNCTYPLITKDEASGEEFTYMETLDIASGEEFTYQWQRNGSDLVEKSGKYEGVNTSVLTIIDARNEDEGSYRCVIFNGAGDNATSNEAFLSVGKLSFSLKSQTLTLY